MYAPLPETLPCFRPLVRLAGGRFLFLFLFPVFLAAQESFVIRSFASAELPAGRVNAVFQDRRGFIWIGGFAGLYRYDGIRFTHLSHDPGNSNSLSYNHIRAITQDAAENLWIATFGGVNRLDMRTGYFTVFPFPGENEAPDQKTTAIFADSRNGIWAGTYTGKLYRLDPKNLRWTEFPSDPDDPSSFPGGWVRAFHEDSQGYVWIGSRYGLSRFDYAGETFTVFQHDPQNPFSLSAHDIWSIFEDGEGVLWFGSGSGGLNRFDRESGRFTHYRHEPGNPASLSNDAVYAISQDQFGNLWAATQGGGLNCLNRRSGRFTAYTQQTPYPHSINHNEIWSMIIDRQGLIWIGSVGGLNRVDFQSKPFKKYFHQFEPTRNASRLELITAVVEDTSGILWLGTFNNGLIRFDRKTGNIQRYRHDPSNPHSLSNDLVRGLAEDDQGGIWIANDGLDRLDPRTGRFTRYRHDPGDPASITPDPIWFPFKDSRGKIWITAINKRQFQCYDEASGRFLSFEDENTKQCCIGGIHSMIEGPEGVFWLASMQGLHRWDRKNRKLTTYLHDPANPHSVSGNALIEPYVASDGAVWVVDVGSGLNRLDPQTGRFRLYSRNDGLPNEQVAGILEDERGRLWITSMGGLSCFDPGTGKFQNFDVADGLPSNEFHYSSRFRSPRTGELLFGSINGLLAFHPDSIRPDSFRPPVVFTSFTRFNSRLAKNLPIVDEWISGKKSLTLTHLDNVLTFEFAALNFRNPEGNRYAYQLEGFSDQWVPLGAKRDVTFTNLAPGRYTLRVKAANDDGVWNDTPTELYLRVLPPWYWSWWSRSVYLLLFAGAAVLLYRILLRRRLAIAEARRLAELDAVKSRLYTNITHEFRTPLTVILGMAEQLQTKADETVSAGLALIRRNGRQLLELVNQMLDLSKLESGVLKLHMVQGDVLTYLRYLAESFHSLAESKRIRLHFLTELPALNMDFEPLRLQQIISNLLSNAFKFTPEGGDIYLFANKKGEWFEIRVKDTGIGIPEEKLPYVFDRFFRVDDAGGGTGIGLALTKELVLLMKGEISVSSKPGGGTEFTVLLPITRTAKKQEAVLPETKERDEDRSALSPAAVAPASDDQAPLLLLVEDNHDVVKYLLTCLNSDYRVEVAYNGRQGVEKAVELTPDLIVSDVMMPQKDGFELCHELKTDERTSHIPIILLTARADMESKLSGLRRGADAYLAKPFHREELLTHIHNLLEVRRRLQAHYLARAGLTSGKREPPPAKTSLESALEHAFIQKIKAKVEEDLSRRWEVPELAQQLHVSVSQLHRKLEHLTGMHATEFIRYVRLSHAARLLRERPEEKIAAIAYEVGFTSPSEFTRRFGEVFGVSPGAWRRG